MYRKELNERSPVRILDRSIHGGLGKGNLGVVMARAGVGKTAFLIQVGLDDAMRDQSVLHIALDQSLEHALGWYDAVFDGMEHRSEIEDLHAVRQMVGRRRIIQAFPDRRLTPERLQKVVDLYIDTIDFSPSAILIDGWDWDGNTDACGKEIAGFKAIAGKLDAELWMSAQTHREETTAHPTEMTPPCGVHAGLIDVAVFLEPEKNHVTLRLLKDHDDATPPDTHLQLDPDTLQLISDDAPATRPKQGPRGHTQLSGGHVGAEEAFGKAAEKWGVREINFSWVGRGSARKVGLVELTDAELHLGSLSSSYIDSHLHSDLVKSADMSRILQTIWHQVTTAGQVFSVGMIQEDKSVRGGTGWAVYLAKHFHKPVYFFDQEREAWFTWRDDDWVVEQRPLIRNRRYCATGTKSLNDAGKAAIERLFEDSFGAAEASA